jgi:hypothetical protein
MNVLQVVIEKTEIERQLTSIERNLINELDHVIGSLAFKAARIVRGIKAFDALGSNDSFHSVH